MDVKTLLKEHQLIIVDSLMGTGKTTAMLQLVKEHRTQRFLFVTPLLDEVERVKQSAKVSSGRRFVAPEEWSPKLPQLHEMLKAKHNVAITHTLFRSATEETRELIRKGHYVLILDEEFMVYQKYNDYIANMEQYKREHLAPHERFESKVLSEGDQIQIFRDERWVSICDEHGPQYGSVRWNVGTKSQTKYSEVERLSKAGRLYCVMGSDREDCKITDNPADWTLYLEFDPEMFRAFKNVLLLSYHFEGSQFNAYLHIHKFDPFFVSTRMITGAKTPTSVIVPYDDSVEQRREIAKLLGVYTGSKNEIGQKVTPGGKISDRCMHVTHLTHLTEDEATIISKAMYHFYKNIYCKNAVFENYALSKYVMWTTVQDAAKEFAAKSGEKKRRIYLPKTSHLYTQSEINAKIEAHNKRYEQAMKRLEELDAIHSRRQLSERQKKDYRECCKLRDEGLWTKDNFSTFLSHNLKATNKYSDRRCLLYMLNRRLAPGLKLFFKNRGYEINEDVWALSEMIQWIWRSAIRNGEQVMLFIPSLRMRTLLFAWMGVTAAEAAELFNEESKRRMTKEN